MRHESRLFGPFEYREDQILTFPEGLLGFPECRRFVLKGYPGTFPVHWLLSLEPNGPELALVDPAVVSPSHRYDDLPLSLRMKKNLHIPKNEQGRFAAYAVVTMPENIKHMSMNLRTPILLNSDTKRGIHYESKVLEKKPVRCLIYRDLIFSRPEDKTSLLVIKRRENETIDIGEEISIQVMDIGDGGVRLGVNAPRTMRVTRGEGLVTPICETVRANEEMDIDRLEGVMHMHRVMTDPKGELAQTAKSIECAERAG